MASYDRDLIVRAMAALNDTVSQMRDIPPPTISPSSADWAPPTTSTKSDAVKDLMRHLPSHSDNLLGPNTQMVNYRHPNWIGIWLPFEPFGGGDADINDDEIVLTTQMDSMGTILILDTLTGNARAISDTMSRLLCARHSDPEECPRLCRFSYGRGISKRPGLEILQEWRQNFLSLKWAIDTDGYSVADLESMSEFEETRAETIKRCYQDHGWPHNFRAAECRETLGSLPYSDEDEDTDDNSDTD